MRIIILLLLSLAVLPASYGQGRLNLSLKKELDSLILLDQKYREALFANLNGKGDSLAMLYGVNKENVESYLWSLQGPIDSLNTARVEEIFNKHGYPGISLVGKPTNEVAFYIIQHSKVIDKYLPLIKNAAEKGELRFELYAMMLDRSLMFQDKEQVYGTQGSGVSVKNKKTGKWEDISFIWPIKDPRTVNDRRKAAGFDKTVEEYAKSMGIEYELFTLQTILKLREDIRRANSN